MKNAITTAFLAGGVVGALLIGGVAATWARLTRTRADLAKARGDVRTLTARRRAQVLQLGRGVGVIVIAVLVIATLWLLGSGPR